jgi:hypothetical protein
MLPADGRGKICKVRETGEAFQYFLLEPEKEEQQ